MRILAALTLAGLVSACGGSREVAPQKLVVAADCGTIDARAISPFVLDPFQRDLAIDIPKRVTEHLDEHPELICATLTSSRHGDLAPIGYAAAHRPDAQMIFRMLIDRGADPDDAVGIAAELGKNRVLDWLLDHGADPDAGDALLRAAANAHYRTIERLLAAGADPRRTLTPGGPFGDDRPGALHLAARTGRADVVELLLAGGADYNQADSNGHPPLHEAVRRGDHAVILALVEGGADPWLMRRDDVEQLRRYAERRHLTVVLDRID